ncbi:MAG: NAD(P)-dependent oxidoreductase [Betaproteobacteria bacterium]
MNNHFHVGLAGTGKMGAAMVKRLLSQGHSVTIWNRTIDKTKPLVELGAKSVPTLPDLVSKCDRIITILTDENALDSVYKGPNNILSVAPEGKLFIDMSTVKPAKPIEIGALVKASGASYLECPVGGSIGPASEGKLLGFVGGSEADLERAMDLLNVLCRRVDYLGPLGSGSTMKLAINLPLLVYWQALSEALSIIEPLHLDPKRAIEIISETSGAPNMLKTRGGMIASALGGVVNPNITVDVATMRKDLQAMIDQAASHQRTLPLTSQALACFTQASDEGLSHADCTALLGWWLKNKS